MSVTALQVESLPSGGGSLHAWLLDAQAVLGRAADINVTAVEGAALVDAGRQLTALASRLAALHLAVVAEVDRRSAARRVTGATSTAAWLRADGMSAGAAARQVALAGAGDHRSVGRPVRAGRCR